MIIVYRGHEQRDVKASRLQEYLDAGWKLQDSQPIESELKTPAKVKAAVKPAEDDNAINKGEE